MFQPVYINLWGTDSKTTQVSYTKTPRKHQLKTTLLRLTKVEFSGSSLFSYNTSKQREVKTTGEMTKDE